MSAIYLCATVCVHLGWGRGEGGASWMQLGLWIVLGLEAEVRSREPVCLLCVQEEGERARTAYTGRAVHAGGVGGRQAAGGVSSVCARMAYLAYMHAHAHPAAVPTPLTSLPIHLNHVLYACAVMTCVCAASLRRSWQSARRG